MASLIAASKSSEKLTFLDCDNSADQLPLKSPGRPSAFARQVPFQPVLCISADQPPLMTVAPPASFNVQKPRAARAVALGATLQVPTNIRPSSVRAAQDEELISFSLKVSLT